MIRAWTIAVVVGASLAAVGCGDDDGSGGAGGGTTTSTNGPTTAASTATSTTTNGSTNSSSSASSTSSNGTTGPATSASTGGGMAQFGEACTVNEDCESDVCHNFPNQGGMLCTLTCQGDNDCPAPSSGCNMMGFCRPN